MLEIPGSIGVIPANAFENAGLKLVVVNEGVTAIDAAAFAMCTSLQEVQLPTGLTAIGGRAFEWCSDLKKIELPESLKSIGASAFSYCSALAQIKLPTSLEEIGKGVFNACAKELTVEAEENSYAAQWAKAEGVNMKILSGDDDLPDWLLN